MISRLHLSTLLFFSAILWGCLLFLDGVNVTIEWLRPLTTVVGLIILLLVIFDKWLWKFSFLYPWFVSIPNLQGVWIGTLSSSWVNPETKQRLPPIDARFVINQTFSTLNMQLITSESKSNLLTGSISQDANGTCKITGIYQNDPDITLRERSPIHYGSILLEVQRDSKIRLVGEYWTDRLTKGSLRFHKRSDRDYQSDTA